MSVICECCAYESACARVCIYESVYARVCIYVYMVVCVFAKCM